MSAEIEYLILEHLKAIHGSQAAMQADLRDIKPGCWRWRVTRPPTISMPFGRAPG